jgi:EmrB/QacA subfamily drug resistance transporter
MSHATDSNKIDPIVWKVAAVVFLGPFMTTLDSTVVNLSLSALATELHSSISSAQWIISGYLLALALMLPLSGWLVDRIGAKRVYLGCFTAFTAASLLCGYAHTMAELIVFRVLQGMAGGLLAPMAQMMIARVAGRHMARVMGYTVVPILIAPILGPVIAGAILKYASWPWLFYLNLPVGVLALALAAKLLPGDQASIQKRPFDFLGFILISPGLAGLLYGLEHASGQRAGLANPIGTISLVAGGVLLLAFTRHAVRKKEAALIDVWLFKNRLFSTAAATQFLSNGLMFAGQVLVPLYLINGCGISPIRTGGLLAPLGVGMLVSVPLMGAFSEKYGYRAVSTGGALLATLGTLPFLWMIETRLSVPLLVIGLFVRGAGMGAINIPTMAAAYSEVPTPKLPVATTTINIVQRLGGPVATTLTAIVLALSATHASVGLSAHSFSGAFVLLLLIHLACVATALQLPHVQHRKASVAKTDEAAAHALAGD